MPRAKQQDAAEAEGTGAARAAGSTPSRSRKGAGGPSEGTAEFDGATAKAARPGAAANGSAVKTAPKKAGAAAKVAPAKTATVPAKTATVKEKEAPVKAKAKEAPAVAAAAKSTAAKGAEAKAAVPKEDKASDDKHPKVAPKPAKAGGGPAKGVAGGVKAEPTAKHGHAAKEEEAHNQAAPAKSERATKTEPVAKGGHAAKAEAPVGTSESAKVGHVSKASSGAKVDAGPATVASGTVEAHKADLVKEAPSPKAALPKPAPPAKAPPAPVLPEDDEPRALFYERQKVLLLAERNNYTRQAEELRPRRRRWPWNTSQGTCSLMKKAVKAALPMWTASSTCTFRPRPSPLSRRSTPPWTRSRPAPTAFARAVATLCPRPGWRPYLTPACASPVRAGGCRAGHERRRALRPRRCP